MQNPLMTNTMLVSPSQIQYTFISSDSHNIKSKSFNLSFSLLKSMPCDLLQLQDSSHYYDLCYSMGIRKGPNLYMMPSSIFSETDEENLHLFKIYCGIFNKDIVKVFIVGSEVVNHKEIAALIKQLPFSYVLLFGEFSNEDLAAYDPDKTFSEGTGLISLIKKDLTEIDKIIEEDYGLKLESFNFQTVPNAEKLNPRYPTLYATTNYFTLNQILANYWQELPEELKKEEIPMFNPERVNIQLKQTEVIDTLSFALRTIRPVTQIEPLARPMIIIAPYHFPRYGKLINKPFANKKEKMLFRASQTEQSLDYTFAIERDISAYLKPEQIAAALEIVAERLSMLDNLAYLHAQFNHSPVFRLPIAGKSLNMDLSHFQKAFPNKQSAIKKIASIGKLLRNNLVADELAQVLQSRDGQLVFISDLPMEWVRIGEYPICLTHDVCRIPEFNVSSLINNYIHNQRLNFRILPDILKRTLIIHCADETDVSMHTLFKKFEDLQASLGFTSIICKSVQEIAEAVKNNRPDLLIFDCHGNFTEEDLSSYLVIDDKKNILLTGEDIIEHGISAPIVFISACSTMPNYGYVKFLTDAFFQAGAFTVTATFMPINMIDAAALLMRLLHNLKYQEDKTIFSNWLAYLSHTLRSTMIYETVRREKKKRRLAEEIDDSEIAKILTELMSFNTREGAFQRLKDYLKTINPNIDPGFESLEHEWLSYTTIGRADLIYFENWLHKHQQANMGFNDIKSIVDRV